MGDRYLVMASTGSTNVWNPSTGTKEFHTKRSNLVYSFTLLYLSNAFNGVERTNAAWLPEAPTPATVFGSNDHVADAVGILTAEQRL
jgi:hypothetical protein